jgi:hypothetical protein
MVALSGQWYPKTENPPRRDKGMRHSDNSGSNFHITLLDGGQFNEAVKTYETCRLLK